jgi:hypothetical protein
MKFLVDTCIWRSLYFPAVVDAKPRRLTTEKSTIATKEGKEDAAICLAKVCEAKDRPWIILNFRLHDTKKRKSIPQCEASS